jgi:hypothetical protein
MGICQKKAFQSHVQRKINELMSTITETFADVTPGKLSCMHEDDDVNGMLPNRIQGYR